MLTLRLIYNNFGRLHYQHTPLLLLQNFLTRPIENVKYIEIDDSFSLGASNCHLLWKLNLWTFKVYQNDFRVYRNILTGHTVFTSKELIFFRNKYQGLSIYFPIKLNSTSWHPSFNSLLISLPSLPFLWLSDPPFPATCYLLQFLNAFFVN